MKIALISDWFSEKMGYSENCLPKALALLGHEVHLVTSDAQIYFDSPTYRETYEQFLGPPRVPQGTKIVDGYTVHRLPIADGHLLWRHQRYIKRLGPTLVKLRPDVIQTFDIASPTTYVAATTKALTRAKLFLEAHMHASVFSAGPPKTTMRGHIHAAMIKGLNSLSSLAAVKCYAISNDAAELAVEHMGVERSKVEVCSLGVDTDLFRRPIDTEASCVRQDLRRQLGFADSEIVCVYTGRLTADKGPLILAQAIDRLATRGRPFRGLFVGSGRESDLRQIRDCRGCVVQPFVPVRDLPPFYWVADVGVWPKQESTSQLDAAACGLPLVLSNRIEVKERIDGNGFMYDEGDPDSLASALERLEDAGVRTRMGAIGSERMQALFSWRKIAAKRVRDYEEALGS
jgi:glycosyltransferase involved in cell wall biosynthesis